MKRPIIILSLMLIILSSDLAYSDGRVNSILKESEQVTALLNRDVTVLTDEEILDTLCKAESTIRLIALYNIQEEGGLDYNVGHFITGLHDAFRWGPLIQILKNAPYFPQSTSWIIDSFADKNIKIKKIREKVWKSEKKHFYSIQEIAKIIEGAEHRLSRDRGKERRSS